jgi:hypothetical protein
MSTNLGIVYKKTGERSRGQVARYHSKPNPLFLNKTAYGIDVAGLKPIEKRNSIVLEGQDFESKFTIGFEVEKNELSRGAVKEYELFCGFERDGSCGYEAVTHILPLLPAGQWRTKVYDMMHKAEKIIDDRYSPSDKRCGGHITIAAKGFSGDELRERVRKNAGIILALFRKRLTNTYCGSNRRMQCRYENEFNSTSLGNMYDSTSCHYKYQTALVKSNCLEFRVPSKFESVKQMMRRYELFYELVNFSINKQNANFKAFLKHIKPIILSMYSGDVEKVDLVMDLAVHFQRFIDTGVIHESIAEFLR